MICKSNHSSTSGNAASKGIRRRFVPITFDINRPGQQLTFEKKLPFKTTKVVGLMTVVSRIKAGTINPCNTEGNFSAEPCTDPVVVQRQSQKK